MPRKLITKELQKVVIDCWIFDCWYPEASDDKEYGQSDKINLKIEDDSIARKKGEADMNNIFYIIGVIVVVLFIAGYFGFR